MPLDQDFFTGFRTTLLGPADILVAVFIPQTRPVRTQEVMSQGVMSQEVMAQDRV